MKISDLIEHYVASVDASPSLVRLAVRLALLCDEPEIEILTEPTGVGLVFRGRCFFRLFWDGYGPSVPTFDEWMAEIEARFQEVIKREERGGTWIADWTNLREDLNTRGGRYPYSVFRAEFLGKHGWIENTNLVMYKGADKDLHVFRVMLSVAFAEAEQGGSLPPCETL